MVLLSKLMSWLMTVQPAATVVDLLPFLAKMSAGGRGPDAASLEVFASVNATDAVSVLTSSAPSEAMVILLSSGAPSSASPSTTAASIGSEGGEHAACSLSPV